MQAQAWYYEEQEMMQEVHFASSLPFVSIMRLVELV